MTAVRPSSAKAKSAVHRETVALLVFLLVQSTAAVFYVGDILNDLRNNLLSIHFVFEATITAALVFGVLLGAHTLRRTIELLGRQETALDVARGALSDVIDRQFQAWSLSPAERDVAFLALKGFDVAEIAQMRGVAQGTVRAQLTRIYAKAEVTGRAQFGAFFVEDLLGDGVAGPAPVPVPTQMVTPAA